MSDGRKTLTYADSCPKILRFNLAELHSISKNEPLSKYLEDILAHLLPKDILNANVRPIFQRQILIVGDNVLISERFFDQHQLFWCTLDHASDDQIGVLMNRF